ncbi:ankyrin repeat domain-containing protein [Candidatus Berkiella cookevillensis]|uniref:Ankyrin repeat domain-containing protein n=1 Tax=Candidatus Berkiella cookevillensis TaxID=437022 RepID=A0A0Q9YTG1_9GAMM|nr:ankyrin repeat domain-containing protein [Candidatus Berkiella cookevillensis]MCS5708546.1 ankyrin repeat domain-containing protein [Candidatus Berkiella cookevillensis]
MINFEINKLYAAIQNNDLHQVEHLLTSKDVRDNIAEKDNKAFRKAIKYLRFDIAKLFLESPEVRHNIVAKNNNALLWAAKNGYLEIVQALLEYPAVVNNIAANDNEAFRLAASNDKIEIVRLLLEYPEVANNITANNNQAFHEAINWGYLDILELLLRFPAIANNITVNDNHAFRVAALNGHLAIIELLLRFPAVVSNITANNNLAFRWAHLSGHMNVCRRLLDYPAVRAAVLAADNADENLRTLAQNKENSMRALNLQEQGMVNALQKLYPDLDSENISAIEKELQFLKTHIESRLAAKGLSLEKGEGDVFERQQADTEHQAGRYLFARPNPWMSPEANFVEVTEQGRQASIAEKDWHLLALIWRALNDENIKLNADNVALIENAQRTEEGIASLELIRSNLIKSFISTLALLARAHNYDDNENDDGKLDKPSCSMGVTQRLLTGLIGLEIAEKPDARPIGADYLAARFKEQLITHEAKGLLPKLKTLSHAELVQLNKLLDKFIIVNDASAQEELSSTLAFESQEVDAFIEEAKNYYGELRFLALHNLSYQGTVYKDAETLIRGLAAHPHTAFANEVFQFVEQELALKAEQQNEANTDVVMLKTNVLRFSETESSNARNPDLLAERFDDMRLDSNESESSSNRRQKP